MRVLHIGNIANNAYYNARSQNEAGIQADVICYDYYHIMGCPEWEEVDFTGNVADQFFPQWSQKELKDYKRPLWFAQGRFTSCVNYLVAHRRGNHLVAEFWWWMMTQERKSRKFQKNMQRLALLHPKNHRKLLARIRFHVIRWVKQVTPSSLKRFLRRSHQVVPGVYQTSSEKIEKTAPVRTIKFQKNSTDYFDRLVKLFAEIYPERADKLTHADIAIYADNFPKFKRLFAQYDLVHAYSVDPIYPMLLNKHPYVAFEHGTIREIPFQNNAQGRLTALAYYLADRVIITNSDNIEAARKMKLTNYEFIPHPTNERWNIVGSGKALRSQLEQQFDATFFILHPARHDWSQDKAKDVKGNHYLIEGLAQFIYQLTDEMKPCVKAIFIEWGNCVQDSKALIAELNLEPYIHWVAPMNRANLARHMDACDVIADQFTIGTFGAIPPQALSLGKPTMIYFNRAVHQWCYGEMPPFINVQSVEEIGAAFKHLYLDKAWCQEISQQSLQWYLKFHSNTIVTQKTLQIYHALLTGKKIEPWGPPQFAH